MERLTDTNGDLLNGLYNKDFETPILRLTDYENTGLAPEEVRTLINNAEKSVFTIKTEIAEKAKAYDKISAENAKLRELLKLALQDIPIAASDFCEYCTVCKCRKDNTCEYRMNHSACINASGFRWQHADEAEEV